MVWVGAVIVILTIVAIVKRYEVRMVLFLSGLIMAILSGKAIGAIDAFSKAMVNAGLVTVICTVMGFAFVMKYTKCDAHLVHLLAGFLIRFRPILIPGAVLVTFAINIALPSAAGAAAAVGAILIPALMSAGIHPAVAGAAVMAGTYGSVLSPGSVHNPFIAKLANTDVMSVIAGHTFAAVVAAVVGAVCLTAIAMVRKEDRGYEGQANILAHDEGQFKVSIIKAIVPIVPLVLLVLGSQQLHVLPLVSVPTAMITGTILGFFVTFMNPQDISKQFFAGMGEAYGSVIGIIVAAAVFIQGMEFIGLTGALINAMKNSQSAAQLAATFGPFLVAVLSGSGDAATLAFNGAITPHAPQFGFQISQMGSLAFITGALGRTMSPVAGAAIICAQLAGVNPLELSRRNALGMLVAAVVTMFILR